MSKATKTVVCYVPLDKRNKVLFSVLGIIETINEKSNWTGKEHDCEDIGRVVVYTFEEVLNFLEIKLNAMLSGAIEVELC